MNRLLAVLPVCAFLYACGGESPVDEQEPVGLYKQEVLDAVGISEPIDPIAATVAVREWVYIRNGGAVLPTVSSPSTPLHPVQDFRGLRYGTAAFWCAGMALVEQWMLEEIGVPARMVSIATPAFFTGASFDSHRTVEVYLNGRWSVHDPTFNVTLRCAADPNVDVSIAEAIACKDTITWLYGSVVFADRTLEVYPVPLSEHLYGYAYYQSRLHPEILLPDFPVQGWSN